MRLEDLELGRRDIIELELLADAVVPLGPVDLLAGDPPLLSVADLAVVGCGDLEVIRRVGGRAWPAGSGSRDARNSVLSPSRCRLRGSFGVDASFWGGGNALRITRST